MPLVLSPYKLRFGTQVPVVLPMFLFQSGDNVDWLQYLKQFFINVSYHILEASLTLMALF